MCFSPQADLVGGVVISAIGVDAVRHVHQRRELLALAWIPLLLGPHQCLFGVYLGCSFAPNHKGMPVLGEDEKLDFLRRQVVTSRNVRGGWLTDLALGGLNYQIEHHLFPSMPRPSLRHAQAPVRAFCQQHGIAYREAGFFASYAQVLRHLHAVGGSLRPGLEY